MIKHYILSRLRLFEQRRHASTARHESIQSAIQDSARTYISQYLLPALESGGGDGRGGVFIFGHTHEPATAVPCLIPHGKDSAQPHSVDLYNTGGWLIDQLSEAGGLQLPKMNPLLIHGAGQVTPIPFLTTHFEWLETLVENDNAFKKLKAQLQAASAPMV